MRDRDGAISDDANAMTLMRLFFKTSANEIRRERDDANAT